jgi:hypothetical protein
MIQSMESAQVVSLDARRERGRRVARAIDVRRGLETVDGRGRTRRGGRAWVNGRELGGRREALSYLGAIHD